MATSDQRGLTLGQRIAKRTLDLFFAAAGLVAFGWLIVLAFVIATIDTRRNGFFLQQRVGRHGRLFRVVKIRTMRESRAITTTVTASSDPRITRIGRVMRRLKIDELPQLLNVLAGQMSFVGPRPDVPGFADKLEGEDRIILSLRPGITGPATLHFRNEEELLAQQSDPETYNREVIWKEKVRRNREYLQNYSVAADLRYMVETVFARRERAMNEAPASESVEPESHDVGN